MPDERETGYLNGSLRPANKTTIDCGRWYAGRGSAIQNSGRTPPTAWRELVCFWSVVKSECLCAYVRLSVNSISSSVQFVACQTKTRISRLNTSHFTSPFAESSSVTCPNVLKNTPLKLHCSEEWGVHSYFDNDSSHRSGKRDWERYFFYFNLLISVEAASPSRCIYSVGEIIRLIIETKIWGSALWCRSWMITRNIHWIFCAGTAGFACIVCEDRTLQLLFLETHIKIS